jgi:hypothetical protein
VAKRSFEDLDEARERDLNERRYRALNELEAAKAQRLEALVGALRQYLDNHAQGKGSLCDCELCLQTRALLNAQ